MTLWYEMSPPFLSFVFVSCLFHLLLPCSDSDLHSALKYTPLSARCLSSLFSKYTDYLFSVTTYTFRCKTLQSCARLRVESKTALASVGLLCMFTYFKMRNTRLQTYLLSSSFSFPSLLRLWKKIKHFWFCHKRKYVSYSHSFCLAF